MNVWGILVGLFSFLLIGALHPVVIKAEYHLGKRCWPLFLAAGLLCGGAALLVRQAYVSVGLGVAGTSLLWCIKELYEQEERVRKGWYPAKPERKREPAPPELQP
jgi:uncharacterized membrane protein YuzA (DUF378 family)